MDWFVKAFLKASVAWLSAGVTLGLAMAARPAWTIYRPAHAHMVLLGFATMMIFGVAYHVVPRFAGNPLHSRRAAGAHWWVSNAGLALMATGFVLRVHAVAAAPALLAVGGMLSAAGAYTFAYLIWRTIDGPASLRAAARRAREATEGARAGRLPLAGAEPAGRAAGATRLTTTSGG
jgi:cbb3-type cytochrome oxidase subunit 1